MEFRRDRGRGIGRLASPFLLAAAFVAVPPAGAGADNAPARPPVSAGLGMLVGPARALKVASLDLPQPIGTQLPEESRAVLSPQAGGDGAVIIAPAPQAAVGAPDLGPLHPASGRAYLELALDLLLELPFIEDHAATVAEGAIFGPDLGAVPEDLPEETAADAGAGGDDGAFFLDPAILFSLDMRLFRPEGFQPTGTGGPAGTLALATLPSGPGAAAEPAEEPEREGVWPSPAQRLSLASDQLARAQKCLAEAIYFESRGETKRGQIAVAQVIVNRVFSGYYPQDVCGTVYQNAHRHLACQFTFACDDVRDVVREPDMWVQAKEIAADMLDGKLWLTSVGRATHYHAYWVHPSWVREMRKLDRIGVHTFYRPRRWGEG